ncbi:HD family phosphohydrolase [uncultured Muribaculum sp.]|uniref:HD family phosphohydrolase n=1 Tax=uncultured Muribaculum sp. TaxID=1918613 RepID=UPI0026751CC3|nr:HDIG domain-containing metalloprotein [uncultured Muribaculum sp.]
MSKSIFNKILIALGALLVIVYFYPHPEANRFNYEEGRPWNYTKLIAPFDIPIHADSATLMAARDTLDARFVPIYELNQLLIDTIIDRLPEAADRHLPQKLGAELRKVYASGVVDMRTKDEIAARRLPKVRLLEKNVLSEMSTSGFTSPRDAYLYLDSVITDSALHQYFVRAGLQNILLPNYTRNEEESRRLYEYDYLTLTADRGIILQGQTIIDKGAIITSQDFTNLQTYEHMLRQLDTNRNQSKWLMLLGQALYVGLLLAAMMVYFYFFVPDVYASLRKLAFMYSLVTLFFLVGVGLNYFVAQGVYIAPMMIVPILVLVFFDGRTALFVTGVLTLICAGVTAFALEFIFLQFCAATAAVFSLGELSRRSQLLRTSATVMLAYFAAYVALDLLMNGSFEGFTWRMMAFLAVNAALTSMAYILMFAVERIFGFISVVTLVELADINTPILMRLSNECPGTFQHSIAVSNLASDAAARIGANVQLVRAGALYHDIGKINNPAFFTENQHGVNPHDALPPERSAAIVVNHVADGLQLADKAGIPEVIRNFIREHHGRGMAKYFYITYCRQHEGEEIDKAPFTYPGPNPQSRETSVLMMADSVEAASRSLKEHTREAITALVNRIVDGQIADGLHSESTLEFRDVNKIKEAFVKRLMTIYHSRIAYPSAAKTAENNNN